MSYTTKFGVTDERFAQKIPSPRPPLPRMMKAKPVKPRTASVGDEKPSDVELEANNSKDYQDSDSLSEDEADDAPNDLAFSHELNSPKFSKKFDHETQNIKRNYAKEPKVVKTQVFNNFSSQKQSDYKRNYYFYIPIVVLILAIAASSYAWSSNSTEKFKETPQSETVLLRNLENNIDSISNKFKQQDGEIWDEIISGVSEVVKHPDKLGIIFLFSQDDYLMNCLAKMIGNASKAALGSSEELMLSPSQLGKSRGYVIDKFKDEITRQKIVIIDNLLDVNPDAMMDFHHLCDRETPLVTRVLYILTMVAKGFDGKKENPLIFVENQLKLKLHNQIDQDKVDPLISRLTDGVIFPVQPEPDFKSCPLRY